jgi:thiol-disulfide isomerase/thioredoxin
MRFVRPSLPGMCLAILSILGAGCAAGRPWSGVEEPVVESTSPVVALPDLGPAPELTNETWLNAEGPLRLADLGGKVVLLEMWTFGCINCQRVVPHIQAWHEAYASQGLVVVGNHYPEFARERDIDSLRQAVDQLGVTYAVAQDNEGATWRAYNNHYWPTLYLIDKRGHLRYQHIGEGAYAEAEAAIQALLAEPDARRTGLPGG